MALKFRPVVKRLCTLELAYLKDITSTRTLKGVFTMSTLSVK